MGGDGFGGDAAGGYEEGGGAGGATAHEAFTLELMMMLNLDNLARLKQQFAKYRDNLDVHEFIDAMRQHLPHTALSAAQEVALVANLSELFEQVDVNGDERMEWEELTSFIVERQTGPGTEITRCECMHAVVWRRFVGERQTGPGTEVTMRRAWRPV